MYEVLQDKNQKLQVKVQPWEKLQQARKQQELANEQQKKSKKAISINTRSM